MSARQLDSVWLAAEYHMASTYSIRVPMSSMSGALALPAPGPATVRLALVRSAIEFFGQEYTKETLFQIISTMPVCVKPPERVALSHQLAQAYKAGTAKSGAECRLDSSILYREHAHAAGTLTVFVHIPMQYEPALQTSLTNIGYWGQSSSLACCVDVRREVPDLGECPVPARAMTGQLPLQPFLTCLMTEFRDAEVGWDEVVSGVQTGVEDALRLELYIWPMVVYERQRANTYLLRRSLSFSDSVGTVA
jgi:hypothetical protein